MKVVVASGSPLLRAVLSESLSSAQDVVSVDIVDSVVGLLESVTGSATQVVLASPTLVDGRLHDAVAEILRAKARVLVICDASDSEEASVLLFAGATGCLLVQDAGAAEILTATRAVAAGHAALHPTVVGAVLAKWRGSRPAPEPGSAASTPPPVQLTARERDVLDALARGLPTKSVGRELGVSPKTVEAHIGRLLTKLGARNRAQAVGIGLERGWISNAIAVGDRIDVP